MVIITINKFTVSKIMTCMCQETGASE